jgi:DNA-directed RNA polymerase subunit RPC12/RpoP
MPNLFNLQCPTCGASLQAAGESKTILCEHCGNKYLFDQKIGQMNASEREHPSPVSTYASQPGQWIKVADVDVLLRTFSEESVGRERVLFVEIEYENKISDLLKYRHDQWIVFDKAGYTYEATMDYLYPHLYAGKIYLGGQRMLNPGMRLRGWLVFILPPSSAIECLQFSAGVPVKTLEFRI